MNKSKLSLWLKKMVKLSATCLPAIAITFATAPCIFKMYEPDMPEQLKK
ncbi:MAG: cyclic lactone autoinducer peptide [Elusimicrobiales bacterium]|nr:cyclic lactone autoinducer peptide [Elusimicrobiales bacterium]